MAAYHPPAIIKSLSQVHKNQRWVDGNNGPGAVSAFSMVGRFDVSRDIGHNYIRYHHGL